MYYCFNGKHFDNLNRTNREISYAVQNNCFIYYDETEDEFKDYNDNIIDISSKKIIPVSFVKELPSLITALEKRGAIIPNSLDDISKVERWYDYFVTERIIIPFKGSWLHDKEFLSYIAEIFQNNPEVFLKTKNKDFNGIVDLSHLLDDESDLRQAFELHLDEEFILSEKMIINEDEIGQEEYRIFVYKDHIMNISRITDTVYHKIPEDLIEYVEDIIRKRPKNFPSTYVLDVFSYQHMYDILEFNPFEASGKYLYNSVFTFSEDLIHQNIEKIPSEKDSSEVSYTNKETLRPSTLVKVKGSFAKDYDDIKKYGRRVDGFIHIFGLPEGIKIDIDELFSSTKVLESDADLTVPTRSLTKKP